MKPIFSGLFIILSMALSAQEYKEHMAENEEEFNYGDVFKKENDSLIALHINNVNPSAVRYLLTNYDDAENIHWLINGDETTAQFEEGDKKIVLKYNKKGMLVLTRKAYPGNLLDPFLAKYARRAIGMDYSVRLVTEVTQKGETIYEISLEDQSHLGIIRIKGNVKKGYDKPELVSLLEKG